MPRPRETTVLLPRVLLVTLILPTVATPAILADWPMYRGDANRSALAAQPLPLPLELAWTHQARHAPNPAWPRSPRMQFDRAFQVVVAGDRVLFGSSADGTVTALSAARGRVCWQFVTDRPCASHPRSGTIARLSSVMMAVCMRWGCPTANCSGNCAADRTRAMCWETTP